MKAIDKVVPLFAAIATITAAASPAIAQRQGTQAQRTENVRAATALRKRIEATDMRIAKGRSSGAITQARAATFHRQVAEAQASMIRLSERQGFVSAAEFASYDRTLGRIDMELDRRGVARSYGNDMLVGPR